MHQEASRRTGCCLRGDPGPTRCIRIRSPTPRRLGGSVDVVQAAEGGTVLQACLRQVSVQPGGVERLGGSGSAGVSTDSGGATGRSA